MDRRIAPLLLLSACLWIGEGEHAARLDPDGDGVPAPGDCDDNDPQVSPAQPEVACDGRDNDCDPNTPDGPVSIEGRTYASIGEAIDAAIQGAVVEVCPGTHAEAVAIDKPLTLEGFGAATQTVIDATGIAAPVVQVTSTGVVLRNLTLTGGSGGPNTSMLTGSTAGGGILALEAGGTLRVEGCVIEGNSADVAGGIAGPLQGNLELPGSVVRGNQATGAAGGVAVFGDANLAAATVVENTAGTDGGGLWVGADAGVSADFTTVVSDNQAARGGGAFLGQGVTWSSGTIEDNVATTEGGGLYGAGVTVAATTVTSNTASLGGGAYVTGRLDDCTVDDNDADSGGGVYAAGDLFIDTGSVSDNKATSAGGGVFVTRGLLTVERDARIERNEAVTGGGIAAFDGALDMLAASLEENTASRGGGIAIEDSGKCPVAQGCVSQVTSVRIVNNDATGQGGGVWTNHGATLSSCTISGNLADEGGGVHVEEPGSVTFATSTVQANSAVTRGAGLHVRSSSGSTTINRGEFAANVGDGAAVFVSVGEVTCDGAAIRNNTAPGDAAVTLIDGSPGVSRYISNQCDYSNNNSSAVKVEIGYDDDELAQFFTCEYGAAGPSCN